MIFNGFLSVVCLVMGCFQYSPRLARVWLKRAPLTSDWTHVKKSKKTLTTQAPIQFQSLLIPIQHMQICFYPNLLVTERQLHRSAPTNNESECEQLPFTRVLSNCYSVPYRWWHGLHPLCSSVCVRMCPCVCMRADILSDDMRHLANYWVLKWWRRKYVFDMDNIQHVWERCVCLCGCNNV